MYSGTTFFNFFYFLCGWRRRGAPSFMWMRWAELRCKTDVHPGRGRRKVTGAKKTTQNYGSLFGALLWAEAAGLLRVCRSRRVFLSCGHFLPPSLSQWEKRTSPFWVNYPAPSSSVHKSGNICSVATTYVERGGGE